MASHFTSLILQVFRRSKISDGTSPSSSGLSRCGVGVSLGLWRYPLREKPIVKKLVLKPVPASGSAKDGAIAVIAISLRQRPGRCYITLLERLRRSKRVRFRRRGGLAFFSDMDSDREIICGLPEKMILSFDTWMWISFFSRVFGQGSYGSSSQSLISSYVPQMQSSVSPGSPSPGESFTLPSSAY